MLIWNQFVVLLQALIFACSQACGGNIGTGIFLVTLLVRVTLLPLTIRLARISNAHQELMRKLKPELDSIRAKFKDKPQRLARETQRVFEREGASPVPYQGCLGSLAQLPIVLALFSAVRGCAAAGGRFFWVRNIAKPDVVLTVVVTAITFATTLLAANSTDQPKALTVAVPTILTFFVLFKISAGIGVYWGASSLVSLLQAAMLRRAVQGSGT